MIGNMIEFREITIKKEYDTFDGRKISYKEALSNPKLLENCTIRTFIGFVVDAYTLVNNNRIYLVELNDKNNEPLFKEIDSFQLVQILKYK